MIVKNVYKDVTIVKVVNANRGAYETKLNKWKKALNYNITHILHSKRISIIS